MHATASLETVVAVVGGLLAGVPVVPVPPDGGPVERDHVLRDSGPQRGWARPELGAELPPMAPAPATLPPADPDATAMVMYTTGTTGPPKGVLLSPGRSPPTCSTRSPTPGPWTPDDVLVHGLPLFHVHGLVLGVLGALRVGRGWCTPAGPTPRRTPPRRGSMYFGVPTVWSRIVADPAAAAALRRRPAAGLRQRRRCPPRCSTRSRS